MYRIALSKSNFSTYNFRVTDWKDQLFHRHAQLFKESGEDYNFPLIEKANTIREFDDGLTRGV